MCFTFLSHERELADRFASGVMVIPLIILYLEIGLAMLWQARGRQPESSDNSEAFQGRMSFG